MLSDDRALVCGLGSYVGDVAIAGAAHGVVLRSPHAHARIRGMDTEDAEAMPGVLAILTGEEVAAQARPIPCVLPVSGDQADPRRRILRPILAQGVVRHVGEPVAFIIAEDEARARDAAEAIAIDYEPLPALLNPIAGAELDWSSSHDGVAEVPCVDWEFGEPARCAEMLHQAAHAIAMTIRNNRVVVSPMETRNAIATYDPARDRLALVTGTQGVHLVRNTIAGGVLELDPEQLEVRTPDVGGGFGSKIFVYPEQVLVLLAARKLRRPVKWVSTRSESFLSDTQARDHQSRAELALDEDGRFLGLRVETVVDLGAYVSMYAPFVAAESGISASCGAYRIPVMASRVRGVLTNTVPVDAYRGAGRPEATYLLERLIDKAASVLGMDRAELRRRNLPGREPHRFKTGSGISVQPGRFADNMERALQAADFASFAKRKQVSRERGQLKGIGFANYLEANGGLAVARKLHPGGVAQEGARLRIADKHRVDMWIGTQSTGQRHRDVLAKFIAARFGLDPERIQIHQGDSGALRFGGGTGGSRSLISGLAATEALVEEVRHAATAQVAQHFGVSEDAISEQAGTFAITGTNTALGLTEIVAKSGRPLDVEVTATYDRGTQANGCHLCEVEVDPATGRVTIERYLAVDDFGQVADRGAVFGQLCGGIVQGVGQALCEHTIYDSLSGQLLTASFNDYAIPRADDVPEIEWIDNGLPTDDNSLGIKACGEAGASGSPPAVMNAIADALAGLVPPDEIQMPATPSAVHEWLRKNTW